MPDTDWTARCCGWLLVAIALGSPVAVAEEAGKESPVDIRDPYIRQWYDLHYDAKPPVPAPGSYGMDPATGRMVHPSATPMVREAPKFKDQLGYWDPESYAHNMRVLAFYPLVVSPWHSWQNIVDFGKRRYLYVYDMWGDMAVYDITDPAKAQLLVRRGATDWVSTGGPEKVVDPFPKGYGTGASTMQWHRGLNKMLLIQSHENPRVAVLDDKTREPDNVQRLRRASHWKGFHIYEMKGPLPKDWVLLSETTTDYEHPNAKLGEQEGSGSLDVPVWNGGRYVIVAAAPNDKFALTEYPDYLYSPGYQVWDIEDPVHPKFVSQIAVPGQIVGNPEDEQAFLMNPRAGNRTSWMGARMPLFLPASLESGGKLGFGAMAGLGLYTFDLSDLTKPRMLGHLSFPPKFAGTEVDNVDTTQYARTGYVLMNGYPMNDECFEPYKDIFVIDARDPAHLKVAAKLPRPMPPANAKFSDYCQRRGSFGPKRPGYYTQPGGGRDGVSIYAFYNAGVQVFDVKDPTKPSIAAYYVPRFPKTGEAAESNYGNLAYGVYIEYDRNIVWMFTNHGIYALATPVLGEPRSGVPATPWPPRN